MLKTLLKNICQGDQVVTKTRRDKLCEKGISVQHKYASIHGVHKAINYLQSVHRNSKITECSQSDKLFSKCSQKQQMYRMFARQTTPN